MENVVTILELLGIQNRVGILVIIFVSFFYQSCFVRILTYQTELSGRKWR